MFDPLAPVARGTLRIVFTSTPHWPHTSPSTISTPVHIAILDSSFNPPHRAHLSMISSPYPTSSSSRSSIPPPSGPDATSLASSAKITDTPSTSSMSPPTHPSSSSYRDLEPHPYTARLLLFSTTNIEKSPSPSDPSLAQRLEMMRLLSLSLQEQTGTGDPIAIGLINEPMFIAKSRAVHTYLERQLQSSAGPSAPSLSTSLSSRLDSSAAPSPANETTDIEESGRAYRARPRAQLTFLLGSDTLTRFFDRKYYSSYPGGALQSYKDYFTGEGSTVVSFRRGRGSDSQVREEDDILSREGVREWVEAGKVRLVGLPVNVSEISSTEVRGLVKSGDWDGVQALATPDLAEYIRAEGLYA